MKKIVRFALLPAALVVLPASGGTAASPAFGQASLWFRKGAGVLIAGLGISFLLRPFV